MYRAAINAQATACHGEFGFLYPVVEFFTLVIDAHHQLQIVGQFDLVTQIEPGAVVAGPLPPPGDNGSIMVHKARWQKAGIEIRIIRPQVNYFQTAIGVVIHIKHIRRNAGLMPNTAGFGMPQAGFQVQPFGIFGLDFIVELVAIHLHF